MTSTPAPAGLETVLVVEDEARVRQITVERLKTLGYQVLEAENGRVALDLLKASQTVDLVFTDVVMPGGMSGTALAKEIRRLYPEIKLLLTSGYTEHTDLDMSTTEEQSLSLRKPYKMPELAEKLRWVLDS